MNLTCEHKVNKIHEKSTNNDDIIRTHLLMCSLAKVFSHGCDILLHQVTKILKVADPGFHDAGSLSFAVESNNLENLFHVFLYARYKVSVFSSVSSCEGLHMSLYGSEVINLKCHRYALSIAKDSLTRQRRVVVLGARSQPSSTISDK